MIDTKANASAVPHSAAPSPPLPPASGVSLEQVRHVAALANLQLSPQEEPRMQQDLNAILDYVAALQSLDTSGVPAMAQVGQLLELHAAAQGGDLRRDSEKPSIDRSAVLHEAPETDGRFFKVPKVIAR